MDIVIINGGLFYQLNVEEVEEFLLLGFQERYKKESKIIKSEIVMQEQNYNFTEKISCTGYNFLIPINRTLDELLMKTLEEK